MVSVLLDTCVLSELNKPVPSPLVVQALASMDPYQTYLSVITLGELVKGICLMPHGRRRRKFEKWYAETEDSFGDRILPIEPDIARMWGRLTADFHLQGRHLASNDGLIAASAIVHGMSLMTRNVKDFDASGVMLINPWDGEV
jgi:toxin FitB